MNVVYIVVKEYSDFLAKRQPWYGIKKLINDLNKLNFKVKVVSTLADIPLNFNGRVIKLFGVSDIFDFKIKTYRLIYFFTSPMLSMREFVSLDLNTIVKNWKYLGRIFLMTAVPRWAFKNSFKKADMVLVVSDRLEEYFSSFTDVYKYIPFILDNWGIQTNCYKKIINPGKEYTIGYFGPPYLTRYYDKVIDFFVWLEESSPHFSKKIITRIDENNSKYVESEYTKKLCKNNSEIVSGFLERKELVQEIMDVDILILPFRVVMEELPIVVLESLELGIPVVTTKECGVHIITKGQKNILILEDFSKDSYSEIVGFIDSHPSGDFDKVINSIHAVNSIALDELCAR